MTYHVIKAFDLIEISQITLDLLLSADSRASGNSINHPPITPPPCSFNVCILFGSFMEGICYCLSPARAVCLGSRYPLSLGLFLFPVMPEFDWNDPADSSGLFEIDTDVRIAEFAVLKVEFFPCFLVHLLKQLA